MLLFSQLFTAPSKYAVTALLIALLSPNLQAQETERNWHLGLALGQGQRTNPLTSGENIDIHYVVDFSWYGKHWYFDNGDLGYNWFTKNNFSISSIATFNNERNFYNYLNGQQFGLQSLVGKPLSPTNSLINNGALLYPTEGIIATGVASVSPMVTAVYLNEHTEIAHRKSAINGGFEFLYISPYGDVQVQVLTDISNTHKGHEAWLSWSHPWYTRRSEISLTLGLEWKSAALVGYYFGVEPSESFVGRPVYEGASGTNAFIRLAGRYNLSKNWNLAAMVEREHLSAGITASPIVNTTVVDTYFAGLFYSF